MPKVVGYTTLGFYNGSMPYKDPEDKKRYQREWQKTHRRKQQPGSTYYTKQRQNMRDLVRAAKDGKPCMDCGVIYPHYVMDFDHRPEEAKIFAVSQMVNFYGREMVLAEIAKCDLLCANCHRERTFTRSRESDTLSICQARP